MKKKRGTPASSIPPNRQAVGLGERLRAKIDASTTGAVQMPVEPADPIVPGYVIGGRYRVERPIGRGAFCRVYKAVDEERDGLACAVKVPRADWGRNERLEARLRTEARATSMLESPHTAPAFDFGLLDDGRPYFVMEFLKGLSLTALLARDRRVHEAHVAFIASDVLHALQEAHELGIVHRDVKPSNVLVVHDSRAHRPYARVLDFGIAKVLAGESVLTATNAGITGDGKSPCTPLYAAPEQLLGNPEKRSDIYALGMLMATLLDGRAPYGDLRGAQLVVAQTDGEEEVPFGEPTRASVLYPIVRAACAKRPDRRFDSAAAMRNAVRAVRIEIGDDVPPLDLSDTELDFEGEGTTDPDGVDALSVDPL